MKISYAITVCDEIEEIKKLLPFIEKHKQPLDEIVILYDTTKNHQETSDYLFEWVSKYNNESEKINSDYQRCVVYPSQFNGDFADWKNKLLHKCDGDWVFFIDADELPHYNLIKNIPDIIEYNSNIEAYWVPRINTLSGNDDEIIKYVASQGWIINENGYINYPDIQLRIFKNDSSRIYFEGKVHERVIGYKTMTCFPSLEQYSLYHPKTLERQIKQNIFYSEL